MSGGSGGGETYITAGTAGSITLANQSWVRADDGGTVDLCVGSRNSSDECLPGTGSVSITNNPADGQPGISAEAGDITIVGGSITIGAAAVLDASNPTDDGGSIGVTARGALSISGMLRANGTGNNAWGGDITVQAVGGNTATIGGTLRAVGGTGPDASDGTVTIDATCAVVFSGLLDTNGLTHTGTNTISYRQSLNASGGRCQAGTKGSNEIDCRAVGGVCIAQPSGWSPANCPADIFADPTIGPCDNCGGGEIDPGETCDDGNTTECDSCSLCQTQGNGSTCSDGNACTGPDSCHGTVCTGMPLTCPTDNNVCTTDSCDPSTGCVYTPNSNPCTSDGDPCTADICSASQCTHPPLCNDGDPCTACSSSGGSATCSHTPLCNDGNACTTDLCNGGICSHGTVVCPDDGNACTDDTCAPASGCTHVLSSACASQVLMPILSLLESGCGDNAVDPGEDCDGGAGLNRNCCSTDCHFRPAGTVCGQLCGGPAHCDATGACH